MSWPINQTSSLQVESTRWSGYAARRCLASGSPLAALAEVIEVLTLDPSWTVFEIKELRRQVIQAIAAILRGIRRAGLPGILLPALLSPKQPEHAEVNSRVVGQPAASLPWSISVHIDRRTVEIEFSGSIRNVREQSAGLRYATIYTVFRRSFFGVGETLTTLSPRVAPDGI